LHRQRLRHIRRSPPDGKFRLPSTFEKCPGTARFGARKRKRGNGSVLNTGSRKIGNRDVRSASAARSGGCHYLAQLRKIRIACDNASVDGVVEFP
jgi:hypothetical protein